MYPRTGIEQNRGDIIAQVSVIVVAHSASVRCIALLFLVVYSVVKVRMDGHIFITSNLSMFPLHCPPFSVQSITSLPSFQPLWRIPGPPMPSGEGFSNRTGLSTLLLSRRRSRRTIPELSRCAVFVSQRVSELISRGSRLFCYSIEALMI